MKFARYVALALLAKQRPIRKVSRAGIHWKLDLREAIDLSIYLTGYFQRRVTQQVLANLPPRDATFIDVGCNRGSISIPVALRRPKCKVISIDPVAEMLNKLDETRQLNPSIENITAICQFLSSQAEATRNDVPKAVDASWNVFSRIENRESSCARPLLTGVAKSVSLDALCKQRALVNIAVIKLDVDGFELDVLKGARETVFRWSPILAMEWAPGSLVSRGTRLTAVSEFVSSIGYRPWRIRTIRKPAPVDWSDLMKLKSGESCELLLTPPTMP